LKLIILAAGLLSLCGAGFAPSPEWDPKQFPISFWCGPPDQFITVERYREVAEAGFNYLMPPCEGSATPQRNRLILETAKSAGLKAFIQDSRMPLAIGGDAAARERIDAIVKDFSRHPAFAGYFITDEPSASAFPGLAEVVAYLREKDPRHPAYINLFPNYASTEQLGVPNYRRYVTEFIRAVKPFAVSYDHYHLLTDGDRPTFFPNLATVRDLAIAGDLPFWQIVLTLPHFSYRSPTEAEKRFDAFQTLAYGGKGLMYYTYWHPGGTDSGEPIISHDGKRTPQFDEIKRINADVAAAGKYLVDAIPSAVFHTGNRVPGGSIRPEGSPVNVTGPGDITVGIFRRDTHLYTLLANRDYKKPVSTEAVFSSAGVPVEMLDRKNGRWIKLKSEATPDGDIKSKVELAPGDGELFRW
jgi:hypothetical protein